MRGQDGWAGPIVWSTHGGPLVCPTSLVLGCLCWFVHLFFLLSFFLFVVFWSKKILLLHIKKIKEACDLWILFWIIYRP